MKPLDRVKFLIGLVFLFAGLNVLILLSHLDKLYGVLFLGIGLGLIIWANWDKVSRPVKVEERKKENIAARIILFMTLGGRLKTLLPVGGIAIIALVILYNSLLAETFHLGSNDYVTLMLAGVLIAYNFIPVRFAVERDFAFLFVMLLFLILVIPTTLLSMQGGEADTNSPLTYYLLSFPTMSIVGLFGIDISAPQYNMMRIVGEDGHPIFLNIGLSCTGLYSVAIFVSAFIAFIAIEYKRFDEKVLVLLGIGIAMAWFANVLRMAIIVLVGYHYGTDAMLWTHNNIGEIIFMVWVILFWLLMFKLFGVWEREESKKPQRSPGAVCARCGEALSPSQPSRKCDCGAISHIDCLSAHDDECAACGRPID